MRKYFYLSLIGSTLTIVFLAELFPKVYWFFLIVAPLGILGIRDSLQTKRTILRNFPVIGHFRYLFEGIRPEIQQYFVERDTDGKPFSKELRSIVYQRSKGALSSQPFGTKRDTAQVGYEWLNHSIAAIHPPKEMPRVVIGGESCSLPYSSSILNISAMSFGSLSSRAILSLSMGAKKGGFAHNTGEGGLSPYHLHGGGDLIWQIGTGYFGCRDHEGNFNPEMFKKNASHSQVKMIELKISQGAKPGHGGILPAGKVTEEIAKIRGVPMGKDVLSPPAHSEFSTPIELLEFVQEMRELSGGKPVGFKLCVGKKSEFLAICKAMLETKIYPDFISVDGGEGGTGAAPLEFANFIGLPSNDGLNFVHNALKATNLRDHIKIISSGKVVTGFDIVKKMALGADLCYSARAMMMALGCIQALRCNSNDCPVGVATQDKGLEKGLVVEDKYQRVARFHNATVESFMEVIAAAGLKDPKKIRPFHVQRRVSESEVKHYGEIFPELKPGSFDSNQAPISWMRSWNKARANSFRVIS